MGTAMGTAMTTAMGTAMGTIAGKIYSCVPVRYRSEEWQEEEITIAGEDLDEYKCPYVSEKVKFPREEDPNIPTMLHGQEPRVTTYGIREREKKPNHRRLWRQTKEEREKYGQKYTLQQGYLPTRDEVESVKRSLRCDAILDRKADTIRIFIFGGERAGRSSFLRQLKISFCGGYSLDERRKMRYDLHHDIISTMQKLWQGLRDNEREFPVEQKALAETVYNQVLKYPADRKTLLSPEQLQLLDDLWCTNIVQEMFEWSMHYDLIDGSTYLMNRIALFKDPDYLPTDAVIVHLHSVKKGISEVHFSFKNHHFNFVDFEGSRSPLKRRWLYYVDNIRALCFIIGLSDFDYWDEELGVNRLEQTVTLWENICMNPIFGKCTLMMYFNKVDLLRKRVAITDLDKTYPVYVAGQDLWSIARFIESEFLQRMGARLQQDLFLHHICAVDIPIMKTVLRETMEIVMEETAMRIELELL